MGREKAIETSRDGDEEDVDAAVVVVGPVIYSFPGFLSSFFLIGSAFVFRSLENIHTFHTLVKKTLYDDIQYTQVVHV